jgi:hypothetical protein
VLVLMQGLKALLKTTDHTTKWQAPRSASLPSWGSFSLNLAVVN